MADPTAEFFAALGRRRHDPLLGTASGTVRFVIDGDGRTEQWLVRVHRGDITAAAAGDGAADAVLRADRALFDRLVRGETRVLTSALRGAVGVSGDMGLLVYVARLFPGPAGERQPPGGGKPRQPPGGGKPRQPAGAS